MRIPWAPLLVLLLGCGDDRLPAFATGEAPPGSIDASTPLDASPEAAIPDAGDGG
jgi:hypothetical protein